MITEKVNRITNWKEFLVPTKKNKRVERFLNSRGIEVFTGLVSSISQAIDINAEKLHVVVHPNVTAIVIIRPHDYMEILKHALQFFEVKQEYTLCAETVKVRDKVRKFRSKKIEDMKRIIKSIENDESKD